MGSFRSTWLVSLAALASMLSSIAAAEPIRFRVKPPIHELSGMVTDRARGALWSLGDSGSAGSSVLARTSLSDWRTEALKVDAPNFDWEAIALDAAGRLWIVDAGDNRSRRASVQLYEVDPSSARGGSVAPRRRIEVRFAGGARDVEAAVVVGEKLALIEKNYLSPARVAWVDVSEGSAGKQTIRDESKISGALAVTDAALEASGSILLLTYDGLYRCVGCFGSARANATKLSEVRRGQSEALAEVPTPAGERILIGDESGWIAEHEKPLRREKRRGLH